MEAIVPIFGWALLVNISLLVFSTVMLLLCKKPVKKIHSSLFAIPEEELDRLYFDYLARFKALVIVFNLSPYIAMRICM